jgi:hypothetical protein
MLRILFLALSKRQVPSVSRTLPIPPVHARGDHGGAAGRPAPYCQRLGLSMLCMSVYEYALFVNAHYMKTQNMFRGHFFTYRMR